MALHLDSKLAVRVVVPIISTVAVIAVAAVASAQSSRCADCHFANPQDAPYQGHLFDWDVSPHGRNGVGCEACHGGDPDTFESLLAHQGILNSRNPASPVHRWNLPRTCGTCHTGPFVAFQDSRHYELLRSGDDRAPACTTCHGEVAARLLSPTGLENQCAQCHGPGEVAEQTDFPPEGRMMLEGVEEVRTSLDAARELIESLSNEERRRNLEAAYVQAEVPLIEAVQSGHRFVFDQLQERLQTARERVAALFQGLVNPVP